MTSPIKYLTSRNLISAAFLLMFWMLLCQNLLAQTPQNHSVAHLVKPSSEGSGLRPRLVGSPSSKETETGHTAFPSLSDATSAEKNAFDKTNQARMENGLPVLVWAADLCRLARAHSENMARQGYFAHETPEGLQLKDRARAMGILHFKVIGENIAYNKGYDDPGAFAVERWMNSGGHRANMLYVGFQASAIGSYVSSDGSVYLTQVFITR